MMQPTRLLIHPTTTTTNTDYRQSDTIANILFMSFLSLLCITIILEQSIFILKQEEKDKNTDHCAVFVYTRNWGNTLVLIFSTSHLYLVSADIISLSVNFSV